MELIIIAVLAGICPVLTITAFIVGYNVNATRKILALPKKERTLTPDEEMLKRIDAATVYNNQEKK